MSETSKIEWTKSTFNPWIGCTKISPGCDNCYAEVSTPARSMKIHWGAGQQRYRTAPANWNQVRRWNAKAAQTGEFWPVFCASLADIFDNEVPDEWRADFWTLVRECPHLTFQVLTKRIGNVKRMLPADWGDGYLNVWLGISVVNQAEADRDIPKLLNTPARVRWLSMEPLLGTVDLRKHLCGCRGCIPESTGTGAAGFPASVDWVVVGGESGHGARPMHPDWARSIRNQCLEAGVAFMFKQWGEWAPADPIPGRSFGDEMRRGTVQLLHAPGNPEGFFRRGDAFVRRVGRQAAGRLLDGILHNGFPLARVA